VASVPKHHAIKMHMGTEIWRVTHSRHRHWIEHHHVTKYVPSF